MAQVPAYVVGDVALTQSVSYNTLIDFDELMTQPTV